MAPTASDPNDLRLALNPARRKTLLALIGGIVAHMRSGIEKALDPSVAQNSTSNEQYDASQNAQSSLSPSPEQERQRQLEIRIEKSLTNPGMTALKSEAGLYFEKWARDLRAIMRKTCEGHEDLRAQQRRQEWADHHNPPPPVYSEESPQAKDHEAVAKAEAADVLEAKEITHLQSRYMPVASRLTTISKHDRTFIVSAMILSVLSMKHYSAHSRVLLCHLTSSLDLPMSVLVNEETEIATTLMLASKAMTADQETKNRQEENASSRRWKVGLASVAGATLIGVTGGLAAPVVFGAIGGIMGGVGLGGLASFLGIFAMNGALVGTLFGAFGGKMTGEMVDAYAKEVSDFKFLPTKHEDPQTNEAQVASDGRRLRVTIGVNGWLNDHDDVIKPWQSLGQDSEVFALRYEMDALLNLGTSLEGMVSSYAWSYIKLEILKRTVLATLWSALWPVYLLKIATSVDNPFSVARNRSEKAGQVLADALINKAQGERPVTLIGYSLGARVIYSCLRSLAERKAFGLIEDVVLIGAPIPSTTRNWQIMNSVVSGRITNVYSENDYILAFLYRATSIQLGVAGLQPIEGIEGVSNVDLTEQVSGHLRYPDLIGQILKRCGIYGVTVGGEEIENDFTDEGGKLDNRGQNSTALDCDDLIDFGEDESLTTSTTTHFEHSVSATAPTYIAGPPNLRRQYQGQSASLLDGHEEVSAQIANLHVPNQREDSDSEDEGILLVDNDGEGELQVLSGEPESDEDENPPNIHSSTTLHNNHSQEPKSLGAFSPR